MPADAWGKKLSAKHAFSGPDAIRGELSLLFESGSRPTVEAIERHYDLPSAKRVVEARISSRRGAGEGWLELLANGLTFDIVGLAPGQGSVPCQPHHFFGLPRNDTSQWSEAVAILPGPHLEGAGAMIPVLRTMAAVGSDLAVALGARAVCWEPAQSVMDAGYFARVVKGWVGGGAFPALGFTAVERTRDGGVESSGLRWFVGQELRVEPRAGESASDTVKLAVRMIDHMVRAGPVRSREVLTGPDGEPLLAEPVAGGRVVRLWRDG